MNRTDTISTARLYAAAIAFASGGYSIAAGRGDGSLASVVMLLLGVVVVLHGAVLLTSWGKRFGDASGALMLGYAVVMLANQVWIVARPRYGMMDGMGGGMMGVQTGMGWDPGMVALALLMLASGAIMTVRGEMIGG